MNTRIAKFFNDLGRLFMPPFEGLPFVMWCYFVFSYIAVPFDPIWRGDLPDPDDYTYLSQTLDWLQGQNWFDNVQHRMAPPEGVLLHYTRLAEIPIAGVIQFFRLFHYSWGGAALLGSYLLPVLYLAGLFAALQWATARLVTPAWAGLSSFVALFAPALMFKFAPGQVDHHGLETILAILATGSAFKMFAEPNRLRWAIGCGALYGLAMAIALEILPVMALTSALIGLWVAVTGRQAARAAIAFGASLFSVSALLLVVIKPTADLGEMDLLAYSMSYVWLTAGIAAALAIASLLSAMTNKLLRLILSGGVAFLLGFIYLRHFPTLLAGPYGAMDKKLAELFFANLQEAVPLMGIYTSYQIFLCLGTCLTGLLAALYFWSRATDDKKWSWALLTALLASSMMLALVYQLRVIIYALLFSIPPLVAFAEAAAGWIGRHCLGRQRFWAEIGLVLLLGPLFAVFLPALQDNRTFSTGVLMFPVQGFDDRCEMSSLEKILNSKSYATRAPLRIVSTIDQGPELLFRTKHAILSAPYHTNVRGNLDALDFFATTDPADAERIARKDGIDLVVLCRNIPDMYLKGKEPHYAALPDGTIIMRPNTSFAGQLSFHKVPAWLTPIPVPPPSNYMLFEVK